MLELEPPTETAGLGLRSELVHGKRDMIQRVAPSADVPTRTSDSAASSSWNDDEGVRRGIETERTTAPLDLGSAEDAAISFALERERVLRRSEHTASVQRLTQSLTLGAPLWTGCLLLDALAVEFAGAGPLWRFALARVGVGLLGLAVIYRLRQPTPPSPRQLWMLDLSVYSAASILNAWMACWFGGLASPYGTGLIIILVGRGSTTLEPRRTGAWLLGIPALAYPLMLLALSRFDERLAAQIRDPSQLFMFGYFLCFVAMAWLHLTRGADFAWRLRRRALESRNIGRYQLERRLGRGGMAEVWAAHDTALKCRVALKTVTGHRPGSSALARLEREARALAGLTHPNTVRIFDYGVTDDGLWYYAMELLHGASLHDLVAREGPLPLDRLLHIARQILRALGEAHGKGIIHRDIKPDNVFVAELGGERDFVKLLDFGIAKTIAGDDAALTSPGWLTGTPAYMPPEVILGYPADVRSDIYCLGATLYFAATAHPPFPEATRAELLAAHVNEPPPALSSICGESIPPEFERIVWRCMAKDPNDRFSSTAGVLEALARVK